MKGKILAAAFVFLLLFGGYVAFKKVAEEGSSADRQPQTTVKAEVRTVEDVIEANGFVHPKHSTDVRSEVSGRIIEIMVEPGETVERGQILVELDRAALMQELIEAQRTLNAEELRLERARRNFERIDRLNRRGIVERREYYDLEIERGLAEIQVEVQQARVERVREDLNRTTIRAPQSGLVADLDVNEGQVIVGAGAVNEGTRLMSVHDLSELYVRLEVNELDIDKIDPDSSTEVSFDAVAGTSVPGNVSRIHPFAYNQDNIRVFRVDVAFEPGERMVRPGISANVRIVARRAEDVVAVNLSAVFVESQERYVYVVGRNGERERRAVEVGINDSRWVEIVSGLEAGETISLVRPAAAGGA